MSRAHDLGMPWVLLCLLVTGCANPVPDPGTARRAAALDFCDRILGQQWEKAYDVLDSQERQRLTPLQFHVLSAKYRRSFGFEPHQTYVRYCEEHGAEALAHIVFTGSTATDQKFHRDTVSLRRRDDKWGIVLPKNFGRGPLR